MFANKVDIQCQPTSCVEPCLLVRLTFNVNQGVKPDSGTTILILIMSRGSGFASRGAEGIGIGMPISLAKYC
jgi:hypothetical protein